MVGKYFITLLHEKDLIRGKKVIPGDLDHVLPFTQNDLLPEGGQTSETYLSCDLQKAELIGVENEGDFDLKILPRKALFV